MNKKVYATAFYARSTEYVAKMAQVLGLKEDADKYHALAARIREQYHKKYIKKNGKIKGNTQSTYVLSLNFGLVPEELIAKSRERLVKALEKYDRRLSTGFHSTARMMLELSAAGQNELAYELLLSTRFPSWGYSIEQGATTIWERWDGFVEGRGFQNKGMNSFNHYSLGAVGEWLYKCVLGINPVEETPGYKKIIIQPRPDPALKWVKGSYKSTHGRIGVEWKYSDSSFTSLKCSVQIPANTVAEIVLPCSDPAVVSEGGQPIMDCFPEEKISVKVGGIHLITGSGNYEFEICRK